MSLRRWRVRFAASGGLAAGGLTAGHELGYRLLYADTVHRHDVLAATGHEWVTYGFFLAAGLLVAGAFASAVEGFRGGRGGGFVPTAVVLFAIQGPGFVALEVGERMLTGAGPHDLAGPLLPVGLALQALVALAGALLTVLFTGVGVVLAAAVQRPPLARARRPCVLTPRSTPQRRLVSEPFGVRGPPAPSAL